MGTNLQRLDQIAKPDDLDDQKTASEIAAGEITSTDYAQFLEFILSQFKRIMKGDRAGNWKDDPNAIGLNAGGLFLQNAISADENVSVDRDASNNLTFKDGVVAGVVTLYELASLDWKLPREYIGETETVIVDENKQYITYNKITNDGRVICDGMGVTLENG
jgi:hypothetical protein